MADQRNSQKKEETAVVEQVDLPGIIAANVAQVMRDRKGMIALENAVSEWISSVPQQLKTKTRQEILDQVMNGRLALESIYIRVSQSY